ncbi:MAG: alanine racemase [Bacillota bacterium]|uniref:D-TA family PLP-dependent enzyme n=1 Tax=Thermanaerosceptrum fracticalcis TaxID=1712410 RepID=A0A7G6E556_THEFR|nr:alanine racemase [Thermanaerosceptrum fracticalcis]QNB47210.1 D-TA family PLP-dependent enzyme [Thermanaerosceptrum fracticalcis]
MSGLLTPYLSVNLEILENNIQTMARRAKEKGVKLRPHIKAHKMPQIALRQIQAGAVGVTVATLGEAEVMIEAGIKDILVAYQMVGKEKILRLLDLAQKARISVAVDNKKNAAELNEWAGTRNILLPVMIEIDTGLHRCGLLPGPDVVDFVKELQQLPHLEAVGLMTHAGHAYGSSPERIPDIGLEEGRQMAELAKLLEHNGIKELEVSVGSTPTALYNLQVPGVTEIRPGNYVFYDAIQVGLGVAKAEQCALQVVSMVISRPAKDRLVIDAGSKTFALDKGAHGMSVVQGFGIILGYPHLLLERLSEEHGIIKVTGEGPLPELGEKLCIIPNHACTAINLANEVIVMKNGSVYDKWPVAARGLVQ